MVTLVRPHVRRIGAQTVTVQETQELDAHGDPIGDPPEPFDIPGCAVYPAGASEENFRAATTTDDVILIAPVYEGDIKSSATIAWRGKTFSVEGNPMPWLYGSGEVAGIQINLKHTGG